ncbi:hypothetical protein PRZ48_011395 [Zasmidium cellare]|uniref:Uncharacterized protein n=1 Tax=Zasmidium cellare TaxID=395010 RepID=A0ABR0E6U6_ZASCE|nr:hypothetical protein PRZ48_011395 [Zasmidium cellare]
MESSEQLSDMLGRLHIKKYSKAEATAAIRGERIPDALGLPLLRLCTIRGIRYHDGFGQELRGVSPEFTRALNAREIMSDRIPHIENLGEETPYCIWYPEVASEETYKQLVKKYPHMAYHVGRACAVAGYTDLFLELDILPEVHIAEEARECGNMTIFNHIMAKPVRYNVMNDYQTAVDISSPTASSLNADTAVRSSLNIKQGFTHATEPEFLDGEDIFGLFDSDGYVEHMFNITKDMSIDIADSEGHYYAERHDVAHSALLTKLLTGPLPVDLPTVDKDLLICMAAYNGDIDRYDRLRRPKMVDGEIRCCVRGIYHNTMFAIWFSKRGAQPGAILQAITARFIMNNVLSRVDVRNAHLPYLIWYPTIAAPTTYRKLAETAPKCLPQVLRACIVGDYVDLFDELVGNVEPDEAILKEASLSSNRHYEEALLDRAEVVGMKKIASYERWKMCTRRSLEGSSTTLHKVMGWTGPWTDSGLSLYNGSKCDGSEVELLACLPEDWRIPADDEDEEKVLDYTNWPPQGAET